MDYINTNKQAWEEAFEHRRPGWGDDNWQRLSDEMLPFFNVDTANALKQMDLAGKTIAQFCCNNGRELLSAMQLGAAQGYGFDIAEGFLTQARQTADKIGRTDVEFVAGNALEIDECYHNSFDLVFFTIGALTWFEDLQPLMAKVASCLKPQGKLLINDTHPFVGMLPVPGEDLFDPARLDRITYSYFRREPWFDTSGMGYITPEYDSRTFTSFSHTMGDIINAAVGAGIAITTLNEYDYDIGMTDVYDGKGFPLSYLLVGEKG